MNTSIEDMDSKVKELNMRIVNSLKQTNELNSLYCDAYNSFFEQRVGGKLDYVQLTSYLSILQLKVTHIDISAQNIREDCYSLYHSYYNYEKVVELLQLYQELLIKRVSLFLNICNNLSYKASGQMNHKYSFRSYRSDIKALAKYEKETIFLGNKLQPFAVSFIQAVQDETQGV